MATTCLSAANESFYEYVERRIHASVKFARVRIHAIIRHPGNEYAGWQRTTDEPGAEVLLEPTPTVPIAAAHIDFPTRSPSHFPRRLYRIEDGSGTSFPLRPWIHAEFVVQTDLDDVEILLHASAVPWRDNKRTEDGINDEDTDRCCHIGAAEV